jgi:phosphoribosylanthranilate isomerase
MNQPTPHIKICGITCPERAVHAAKLGANYIGLVFYQASPRHITQEQAQSIVTAIKHHDAIPVAVCVNQTAQEIQTLCHDLGITHVQLHGDTARAHHADLPKHLTKFYVLHVSQSGDIINPDTHLIKHLNPTRDYLLFDKPLGVKAARIPTQNIQKTAGAFNYFLAGGLNPDNIHESITCCMPHGVDVSSGVEQQDFIKNNALMHAFIMRVRTQETRFGKYGGTYMPESLIPAMHALRDAFNACKIDPNFIQTYRDALRTYAGRATPLTEVKRFRAHAKGPRLFLKREDLLHTGAHKINHALGQCLLAKRMEKKRIIAETGAGQHGVATATACARLGLTCVIYMGELDMARQQPNVEKMKLLGADIIPVNTGSKTLKDAVNAALRDYATHIETTYYCLGSALGPAPYPHIIEYFQSIIGEETKAQCLDVCGRAPDVVIACVGGGSNAIGMFSGFLDNPDVSLVGVEAGGTGHAPGTHAARFQGGTPGVLHGCYSYVLQDEAGQIQATHSISAGLDYPMVGPHHALLYESKRAHYASVTDAEAVNAFKQLATTEGIIPALESAHALAYYLREAPNFNPDHIVIINLSGRGDKDLPALKARGDV